MSSIDTQEIENFSKDAEQWWDENGPFKPLHRLNPVRMRYIKSQICRHYGRDVESLRPFEGLSFLDVGCGGGLVCEPLARMGGTVSGADADAVAIETAKRHAQTSGLKIAYLNKPAEAIEQKFDVVMALEIIEHVTSPETFVQNVANLVKPGGIVIFFSLNRNPKSFLMGIVTAEYLLRWVPRETHSWKKFLRPSELVKMVEKAGLEACNLTGLVFNPFKNEFELSESDLDVNYLMSTQKAV